MIIKFCYITLSLPYPANNSGLEEMATSQQNGASTSGLKLEETTETALRSITPAQTSSPRGISPAPSNHSLTRASPIALARASPAAAARASPAAAARSSPAIPVVVSPAVPDVASPVVPAVASPTAPPSDAALLARASPSTLPAASPNLARLSPAVNRVSPNLPTRGSTSPLSVHSPKTCPDKSDNSDVSESPRALSNR